MVMIKRSLLLILFFLCTFNVHGQYVNLSDKDSLTSRFITLMDQYNQITVSIDTSEYSMFYPDALNKKLQIACENGYCREIVRLIVKGADINSPSYEKATPLHLTTASRNLYSTEILLLLGANRNLQDTYGRTPLIFASEDDNLEMAELLIRYGAATDSADFKDATPLHAAVRNNSFYITDMLIYYDADLNKTDNEGNTPLMLAVWNGNFDIADILLRAGANPDIADKKGFTPFILAAQQGDTSMLSLLNKANADIYKVNSYGYDAMCIAIKRGKTDAVNFLLTLGNQWFVPRPGKIDPVSLAEICGIKGMDITKADTKRKYLAKPSLNLVSISMGGTFSNHFSFLNGRISFRDPYLKGGVFASYNFNPVSSKILLEKPDAFYQYRLKVRTMEAGIVKDLITNRNIRSGSFATFASLSAAYKFYSEYNGTSSKPANQFCVIPALGMQLGYKRYSFASEFRYMKTPFYKIFPVWLNLRVSVNFFLDHSTSPSKHISLYEQ